MQNTTKKHVDGGFGGIVRAHLIWFLCFAAVALAFRVFFYVRYFNFTPDSIVYANFAKTWLEQHVYGISSAQGTTAADFRLPGYPAYLALCFVIAGVDHYGAACIGQIFVDLGTCFLVAALAWRMA